MTLERAFRRTWFTGLALFLIVILLGLPLLLSDGSFGIVQHQSAGTAARVYEIQDAWRALGLRPLAVAAMVGDLIFIPTCSVGSYLGGLHLARTGKPVLGVIVRVAALVFLITDLTETGLQLMQLLTDRSSGGIAGVVAAMRVPKVSSFLVALAGICVGLYLQRKTRRNA